LWSDRRIKKLLVILSGPSGVGKDTVIEEWRKLNSLVERVVAYTTRSPRVGEIPGQDYHFVAQAKFHHLAKEGAFLESKEVHGNYYATPLHDMEELLDAGKIAVLKIDVQGALDVMKLRQDAMSIFILPPTWEELERRITERGLDSPEVLERRLENAKYEIATAEKYDHQLVTMTWNRPCRSSTS